MGWRFILGARHLISEGIEERIETTTPNNLKKTIMRFDVSTLEGSLLSINPLRKKLEQRLISSAINPKRDRRLFLVLKSTKKLSRRLTSSEGSVL